jgi:hypothetical protein
VVESMDVLSDQDRVSRRGQNSRYCCGWLLNQILAGCLTSANHTHKNVKPHKTNGVMSCGQ